MKCCSIIYFNILVTPQNVMYCYSDGNKIKWPFEIIILIENCDRHIFYFNAVQAYLSVSKNENVCLEWGEPFSGLEQPVDFVPTIDSNRKMWFCVESLVLSQVFL